MGYWLGGYSKKKKNINQLQKEKTNPPVEGMGPPPLATRGMYGIIQRNRIAAQELRIALGCSWAVRVRFAPLSHAPNAKRLRPITEPQPMVWLYRDAIQEYVNLDGLTSRD